MQAERDHLRLHVFPELEERLKSRRCHLEWVDLRVGVATAEINEVKARELHVLRVCLGEVKRCRPFLIVLIGDRYGWVPPPERMIAAAQEEGLQEVVEGRSVTDLEISFGVLASEAQQARSFFYFRDPLPYADMPREIAALYSDAHAMDAGALDRRQRLDALKRRIEDRHADRVRRYSAQWSHQRQAVIGIEAWGRRVLEDIWTELDVETGSFADATPSTWQQEEHAALEDYIEDRSRDFVGRDALLQTLIDHARSSLADATQWGICIVGDSGSGKSALFSELVKRVRKTQIVTLAHAAGASLRSSSVEPMLRRWIEQLTEVLRLPPELPENASPEAVDAAFSVFLQRACETHIVLIAIDALDQFDTNTRARLLTWLPKGLPANARLILTATPSVARPALDQWHTMRCLRLPPLETAEARSVAQTICQRYHRTLEPAVLEALIAKPGIGSSACTNPLWLVLAVEELNLLDADDFARAAHHYAGTPAEQIRTLMLDAVAAMPSDIPQLHQAAFERAERMFGRFMLRAFLGVLAVGRGGWRETDFRHLMPRISGEPWDELQFASLRRMFRGMLRRRGDVGRWDFAHGQMRSAARRFLAAQSVSEAEVHAEIAEYLLTLERADPLRQSETMVHLIGCQDYATAARFFGDPDLSAPELEGASEVLAIEWLNEGPGADARRSAELVLDACVPAGLPETVTASTAERLFDLDSKLRSHASLDVLERFHGRLQQSFDRVLETAPNNSRFLIHASILHNKIGDVAMARGDGQVSIEAYRAALAIRERLGASEPDKAEWQHAIVMSQVRIGDLLREQGELAAAIHEFRSAFAIADRLARADPFNTELQRGASTALERIGGVSLMNGDTRTAHEAFKHFFSIAESLARADPSNLLWQRDLSVAHEHMGDVLKATGDFSAAMASYLAASSIRERLTTVDPRNHEWQSDLAMCLEKLGDTSNAQRDYSAAIDRYEAALRIRERLLDRDPGNARWLLDLAKAFAILGDAHLADGNLELAFDGYSSALECRRKLAGLQPESKAHRDSIERLSELMGQLQARGFGPQHDRASGRISSPPVDFTSTWNAMTTGMMAGNENLSARRPGDAIQAYQQVIEAANEWLVFEPNDASVAKEAYIAQARIAEALMMQGDLETAEQAMQYSATKLLELAQGELSDPDTYRTALVTQLRLGHVYLARDEVEKARREFQNVFECAQSRGDSEATEPSWQQIARMASERLAALSG